MKMNKNKKLIFCRFLFYFPLSTSTINKQNINKVSQSLFRIPLLYNYAEKGL